MPPLKSGTSKNHSLLLGAFAICVLFLITFFTVSSSSSSSTSSSSVILHEHDEDDSNTISHPKSKNRDEEHDHGQHHQHEEQVPTLTPSKKNTMNKFTKKNTKCLPAKKHTPISKAAVQASLSTRMQSLCSSHCPFVSDPLKRPPEEIDNSKFQPDFCRLGSSSSSSSVRFDHGCYDLNDEEENDNNDNDCDEGKSDSSVTAVYTAISNSSVGARFFGGCQEYVWESIRQWRLFHPTKSKGKRQKSCFKNHNRIFLITSDELFTNPLMIANATKYGVTLVNFEKELVNEDWRRYERVFYIQGYMHPCGSRTTGNKDFNKLVSARFFAIEALMGKYNLKNIMCLENDMMVYMNFKETVEAVKNCGWRMASMFPHFKGVIPGLMYVRQSSDLLKLSHFINDLLSCGKKFGKALTPKYANDMTYMLNFYQLYGGQWMGDLPNFISSGDENCVAGQMPNVLHDGASFGQWYSFAIKKNPPVKEMASLEDAANTCPNDDPNDDDHEKEHHFKTSGCWSWEEKLENHIKNTKPNSPVSSYKPPPHIQNSMKGRFLDATPGELLKWRFDEEGRRVPVWGKYRLSSLHVHAKNLWWFRSK